jgi:hypothetical protein
MKHLIKLWAKLHPKSDIRNLFDIAYMLRLCIVVVCFHSFCGFAQYRTSEYNHIGWYTTMGNVSIANKLKIIPEFQWRRDNFITDPQQNLYRLGIQYEPSKDIWLRGGYAFIQTFDYGTYPINKFGKEFPEHRIYGGFLLNSKLIEKIDIQNRLLYEGRWLGVFNDAASSSKVDDWQFLNRIRYMLRLQMPLKGNTLDDQEAYIAAYDEIMMGFGKNVNKNIFDQNRLGLLFGWRFNKYFRMEGGYFGQILQLGRTDATGNNIFQYNRGFIINTYWNINL